MNDGAWTAMAAVSSNKVCPFLMSLEATYPRPLPGISATMTGMQNWLWPVLLLTLLATVGDGVTPGTLRQLPLPCHSHITLVTTSSVCHVLWHDAASIVSVQGLLYYYLSF